MAQKQPSTVDDGEPECVCTLVGAFETLGSKYAIPLVCMLDYHDTLRFGDIERHLPGASTSTLSTRLDDLEDEGWVVREQYDEIPPRVEYGLTDRGGELAQRLRPLVKWAHERE